MDEYTQHLVNDQLTEFPYPNIPFDMEQMAYHIPPEPNPVTSSVTSESFGHYMGSGMDDFEFRSDRSLSYSEVSSQSLSPKPDHRRTVPQPADISLSDQIFNATIDMTSRKPSGSSSTWDSPDEDPRAEVS